MAILGSTYHRFFEIGIIKKSRKNILNCNIIISIKMDFFMKIYVRKRFLRGLEINARIFKFLMRFFEGFLCAIEWFLTNFYHNFALKSNLFKNLEFHWINRKFYPFLPN